MLKRYIPHYAIVWPQHNFSYLLNNVSMKNISTSRKSSENSKNDKVNNGVRHNQMQHILSFLTLTRTNNRGISMQLTDYWDLLGKCIMLCVEQFSYKKKVCMAVKKIADVQDQLITVGDKKRIILSNLEGLRNELQIIHSDIKRSDDKSSERYLQLINEEDHLYRIEKDIKLDFKIVDERERLLFNELALAISDSHEKERNHNNYIRIWTTAVTFCICIGSIIVRNRIEKKKQKTENWGNYLKRHTGRIYGWVWPQQKK